MRYLLHLLLYNLLSFPLLLQADNSSFLFCELAQQTGGQCVPLSSGNQEDDDWQEQFTNTVVNTLIDTVNPTITEVIPQQLPQGQTAEITLIAPKANFTNQSRIKINSNNIKINHQRRLSATQMGAQIMVANTTSQGFYDITVTTGEEVVEGIGILKIVAKSTQPKILSISPVKLPRDAEVQLNIYGDNTHFNQNTSLSFGQDITGTFKTDPQITVKKQQAHSPTWLQVTLQIGEQAWLGYHSVRAQSGSELAKESQIGPLQIFQAGSIAVPPLVVNQPETATGNNNNAGANPSTGNSHPNTATDVSTDSTDQTDDVAQQDETDDVAGLTDPTDPNSALDQTDVTASNPSSGQDNTTDPNNLTGDPNTSHPNGDPTQTATPAPESTALSGTIQLTQTEYEIVETAKVLTLIVERINGQMGERQVQYTTQAETAQANDDYQTSQGQLHWPDGNRQPQAVNIPLIDDDKIESPEAFLFILSDELGHPQTATITLLSDDTMTVETPSSESTNPPPVYQPASTLCPNQRHINVFCNAEGKTLDKLQTIGETGHVARVTLVGEVHNQHWASNLTLTSEATLYGGIVSGYVNNQGTICDIDFKGIHLNGGTLCGYIQNSSPVNGTIENVIFAPNSFLNGGRLAGKIQGDTDQPVLIENVRIKTASHLSNIILGENVQFGEEVYLENVTFLTDSLKQPVTLGGYLSGTDEKMVLLDNVTILPGSQLAHIKLGSYVTLPTEWERVAEVQLLDSNILQQDVNLLDFLPLFPSETACTLTTDTQDFSVPLPGDTNDVLFHLHQIPHLQKNNWQFIQDPQFGYLRLQVDQQQFTFQIQSLHKTDKKPGIYLQNLQTIVFITPTGLRIMGQPVLQRPCQLAEVLEKRGFETVEWQADGNLLISKSGETELLRPDWGTMSNEKASAGWQLLFTTSDGRTLSQHLYPAIADYTSLQAAVDNLQQRGAVLSFKYQGQTYRGMLDSQLDSHQLLITNFHLQMEEGKNQAGSKEVLLFYPNGQRQTLHLLE